MLAAFAVLPATGSGDKAGAAAKSPPSRRNVGGGTPDFTGASTLLAAECKDQLTYRLDWASATSLLKRCDRKPGPQAPNHPGRVPVATDLAELLRKGVELS